MKITYNEQTGTLNVKLDTIDIAIYEHDFIGGPAEGIESLLIQNRRQRRDQVFTKALAELGDGPANFADKDDLVAQHFAKPEYKNAKVRKIEADIKLIDEHIAAENEEPDSDKKAAAVAELNKQRAALALELGA